MLTPAIDILAAKLGEVCYLPDFINHPLDTAKPGVEALGRSLVDLIMGVDPRIGLVPFGLITDGSDGPMATIRGTQLPMGDLVEWWKDFQAILSPCPLAAGSRWHLGFGSLYETLYVGQQHPLAPYLVQKGVEVVSGHSLGGPLATSAAAESGAGLAVLIESPNPGDEAFKGWVNSRVHTVRSYWNPRDIIGRVPFDIQDFEDFVGIADHKILLDPLSVTPVVEDSLWQNHNLTNCRRMMESA